MAEVAAQDAEQDWGWLQPLVAAGTVDTVVVAFTDMQGRLQGKRCHARWFLDEVADHGTEACNYLLAVDVDMNTVDGYAMASWEQGYGDFALRPDPRTLRLIPWHPGSALVLADLQWLDGKPVSASPRQILRRQLDLLQVRGWTALVGTELELMVFNHTYEDAWNRGYRGLAPSSRYNVDYSLLGTGSVEPLLRRIRNEMSEAGMVVESAKGECNLGQHEIAFRYAEALTTADNHSIYKTGSKEIAAQEGMAITFMAKFDEREGNSCHIHLSLRDRKGQPVFAGEPDRLSPTFEHFIAGQLAGLGDLTLLLAPNVNSYKRFAESSFAPTSIAWGHDNRTCAIRVVGHGPSLRLEHRVPGGDVNPYLAIAAIVAAGLDGVERELPLEPATSGNAYRSDGPRVPGTLREASDRFEASPLAHAAFGNEVVAHYTNMARIELQAFEASVTDWERYRGFERL